MNRESVSKLRYIRNQRLLNGEEHSKVHLSTIYIINLLYLGREQLRAESSEGSAPTLSRATSTHGV